jgi:hypothetical protein
VKTLIGGVIGFIMIVPLLIMFTFSTTTAAGCKAGDTGNVGAHVDPAKLATASIDGLDAEQLANAATIIDTAANMGLPRLGQVVGVMTSLGEAGLRNLSFGDEGNGVTNPDGTPTCSVGIFQQQWCLPGAPWGTKEEAMDPAHAATLFFTALQAEPGWEALQPSEAAHRVQDNEDPNHYAKDVDLANTIVDTLTGAGAGGCAVPGDQAALAKELVAAIDAGKLRGSTPDHMFEIKAIADGKVLPDCGIDTRILQVLVLAVRTFDSVAVSDINRRCTGQIEGAGTASSHYIDGGGHAVDFYQFNGHGLTGADSDSIKFITLLDPIMPASSGLGQSNIRAAQGVSMDLKHFTQFADSGTHLHIDVGHADGPLTTSLLPAP